MRCLCSTSSITTLHWCCDSSMGRVNIARNGRLQAAGYRIASHRIVSHVGQGKDRAPCVIQAARFCRLGPMDCIAA